MLKYSSEIKSSVLIADYSILIMPNGLKRMDTSKLKMVRINDLYLAFKRQEELEQERKKERNGTDD